MGDFGNGIEIYHISKDSPLHVLDGVILA